MEEMMTGQKVIKVFCHEEGAKADFDKVNGEIFYNARNGNRFANILMPLLGNIGNVMYVIVALVGGALLLTDVQNISISGMAFSISIVVPFLNMTKQFAGAVGRSTWSSWALRARTASLRCWTKSPRPTRAM